MFSTLTELSKRNVVKPEIQLGSAKPEVIGVREVGGPEDPTDRRLILDVQTLESLLDIAKSSETKRVVLHHIGLKIQLLRSKQNGHRWEHITLIGSRPEPESSGLFGGVK